MEFRIFIGSIVVLVIMFLMVGLSWYVFAGGNDTKENDLINDLIKTGQFTEDEAKDFVSETIPSESQEIISKHMQDGANEVNLSKGQPSPNDISIEIDAAKDKGTFAGDNDYVVKSIRIAPSKDLCPQNNCKFEVSEGEFRMNTYAKNERVFEGILKVIRQEGNSKVSKLIPFSADPTITEIRESGDGTTTEVLEGTLKLGDVLTPDFCYDFDNAAFNVKNNNGILTIAGNHTKGLSGLFC